MSNCTWCGDAMAEGLWENHKCKEPEKFICTICECRPTDVVGCINAIEVNGMPSECMFCCGCVGDCQEYWGSLCCVNKYAKVKDGFLIRPSVDDTCKCCMNECANCREEW